MKVSQRDELVHLVDDRWEVGIEAPPSPSDEELLEGSVTCPDQFVRLYDRYASRLLRFFARRTYDAQTAADLTAETFAQAFAARKDFRNPGPGSAPAWLFTIAHRQLTRFVRKQRVESHWRERLGIEPLQVSSEALERAEDMIDLEGVREQVAAAVHNLKGELREAVLLRVVEGRSYADVARLTGASEALVRQRVSRGLKRLARDLAILREDWA